MRVAFLGLGIMGQPMATNLVKAGHEVTVWNRTPGKMVEGAGIAPTPAAAAQGAEVLWLCVSDTAAVEQILFGAEGVEPSLAEGMIIADSSTISPSATVKFAERVRAKGVSYIDAPMTGSKIGAANGSLIFMVGGEEATIERLDPLFAAMGKKIFRMGETGKGQATKRGPHPRNKTRRGPEATGFLDRGHDGALRCCRVQSALRLAARLHPQFSPAPYAQGHPAHARSREGSAR